jgi:fluoride exporter
MFNVLVVALGGGLGSVLRYLMGLASMRLIIKFNFPFATMLINILGSFLIGVLAFYLMERYPQHSSLRLFVIVGILGGFTTFSAYSLDVLYLVSEQRWFAALLYAGGSVILSLIAVYLGMLVIK